MPDPLTQDDINRTLQPIYEMLDWIKSKEGMDRHHERGVDERYLLVGLVADILHQGVSLGAEPDHIISEASLLFDGELGHPSGNRVMKRHYPLDLLNMML